MIEVPCKSDEEIVEIVAQLQNESPNLEEDAIRRAMASCCVSNQIVAPNDSFIECVRERIRMLRQL